jgi:Fic family protein
VGGWAFDDEDEPDERALLAAENGRAQMRVVRIWLLRALRRPGEFAPNTMHLQILNATAMNGLIASPGDLRPSGDDLEIFGSKHVPPPRADVPLMLWDAFTFVNSQPDDADPVFVAAYILWRICWIHPFDDGNGRTARAMSYLALSLRLGFELPGTPTIPQRIKYAPRAFYRALEAADRSWLQNRLDVSELQALLAFYLAAQMRGDPPGLPPGA